MDAPAANDTPAARALPRFSLAGVQGMLSRFLTLILIWGIGLFLWGSLSSWAIYDQLKTDRMLVQSQASAMQEWLDAVMAPVAKLAADRRLEIGVSLPTGVDSLPVQRVLYEFSYLYLQNDLYVVDLLNDAIAQPASAGPLPPQVMTRLKTLAPAKTLMIGHGNLNGSVYLARKVNAPLPHQVYVLVPVPLGQAASNRPTPTLSEGRRMGLALPHTQGWAWWSEGSGGFRFDEELSSTLNNARDVAETEKDLTVMIPLGDPLHVYIGLVHAKSMVNKALVPQAILLLWMLGMTVLLLMPTTSPLRGKIINGMAPAFNGLRRASGALATPLMQWHGRMREQAGLGTEQDLPLVDGPGLFTPGDFRTGSGHGRSAGNSARKKAAPPVKPLGETGDSYGGAYTPKEPAVTAPNTTMGQVFLEDVAAQKELNDAARDARRDAFDLKRKMKEEAQDSPHAEPLETPSPEKLVGMDETPEDLEAVVRQCLKEGRLKLLYQPIFRASDNKPILHEVYARLIHPNGRVMSPGEFLPVTNRLGLTMELDAAVFRKTLSTYFFAGTFPSTPLALNVGGNSLEGINYLNELLSHGPNVLQRLAFEVRSQEIVRDPKALKLMKDIQKNGGSLAVDYFGGGTAMLQASKAMGFDYVKLDCSRFMTDDLHKKDLITLCATANKVALPVILEKIETPEEEAFARKAGVSYLQGYALAMPAEDLQTAPLVRRATPEKSINKALAVKG